MLMKFWSFLIVAKGKNIFLTNDSIATTFLCTAWPELSVEVVAYRIYTIKLGELWDDCIGTTVGWEQESIMLDQPLIYGKISIWK